MRSDLASKLSLQLLALDFRTHDDLELRGLHPGVPEPAVLHHTTAGRMPVTLIYASTMTISDLRRHRVPVHDLKGTLVVGDRITERSGEQFRQAGANYLDSAGNAFINVGSLYVDIRGRRHPAPDTPPHESHGSRGGVNLFSAKRAQVIFAILAWDGVLTSPLRDIARTAGVALGQVSQTIDLLEQYDYLLPRRRFAPGGRRALTDLWSAAYPSGLGARIRSFPFSGDFSDLEPKTLAIHVTGESAVPQYISPTTFSFYADEPPAELALERGWRSEHQSPNIFYRPKFWSRPDDDEPGLRTVPPLLIYADLLASGDSRQREAAFQLMDDMDD